MNHYFRILEKLYRAQILAKYAKNGCKKHGFLLYLLEWDMACDPSLLKLDNNLSFPHKPRLIPEKKFWRVHFQPPVFFEPSFFFCTATLYRKKSWAQKKPGAENEPSRTFFLGSAWDHGGMIDYSLTFTKRGRKPYVTLTGKGGSHVFWSHICHFWLKFLRVIFFSEIEK